ncbi:MAG: DUF5691 domain-containing protein [Roseiflexaceae bacterium]
MASTDHLDLWEEVVAAATLGTERRAFTPPQAEGPLGAALGRLDPSDQEGALLGAATTLAFYRLTGALAAEAPQGGTVALPEAQDRPECSHQAAQHLHAILNSDQRRELLPEWLEVAGKAGLRVPTADLPELLDLGRGQASLRPLIRTVIGLRGAWLAAQNPDWDYARAAELIGRPGEDGAAQPVDVKARWETGSRAARHALLETLRAADPEAARALVESTWTTERAEDRTAFAERLLPGLSMADEPFLEAALDDRSKEVRRVAAGLLARLPESRLVARMTERLQPLLRWIPGESAKLLGLKPARPSQLEVALPEVCDKPMVRDGIDPKVPAQRTKLGERAWWLMQMLSVVPPATWSTAWGASPAQVLTAVVNHDWKETLVGGWLSATLTHNDADWAEALLRVATDRADLIDALPPARQEALLIDKLSGNVVPLHQHPVLALLRRYNRPWSLPLARAFLRALYRHMCEWTSHGDWAVHNGLQYDFVLRLPPELVREIADGWPTDSGARERWQPSVDRLLITLQFRHDMLAALRG